MIDSSGKDKLGGLTTIVRELIIWLNMKIIMLYYIMIVIVPWHWFMNYQRSSYEVVRNSFFGGKWMNGFGSFQYGHIKDLAVNM